MKTIMFKNKDGYSVYVRLADVRAVEGHSEGCLIMMNDGTGELLLQSSEPAVEVWKKWVEAMK